MSQKKKKKIDRINTIDRMNKVQKNMIENT